MSDPFKPGPNNNPFSEQKGHDPDSGTQAAKERERRIFEEEQARRRHEQEAFAKAGTQSQSDRSSSSAGSQQRAKSPNSSSRQKSAGSGTSTRKARTSGARSTGGQPSNNLADGLVSVAGAVAGGYAANLLMPGNGAAMLIAALVAGGAAYAFRGPLKIVTGVAIVVGVGWSILQNQSGHRKSTVANSGSVAASASVPSTASTPLYIDTAPTEPQTYLAANAADPEMPQTTDSNYVTWVCADIMRLFDLAIDGSQQVRGGEDPAYLLGAAPLKSVEPIDPAAATSLHTFRLNAQPMPNVFCRFGSMGGGWIDCHGYASNKYLARRESEIAGCLNSRSISFDRTSETEEDDISTVSLVKFMILDGRVIHLTGTRYLHHSSREIIGLSVAWL